MAPRARAELSGQFGQLVGPGVPDPHHYDDWKDWARDLGQLLQTSQPQVTQAVIENLLSYQFASWTPTLTGSVTPGAYTLVSSARVVKVASLVVVTANVVVTVVTPGVGDMQIAGLPQPMVTGTFAFGAVSASVPFTGQLVARADANVVLIEQVVSGTPPAPIDIATLSTGDTISFTLAYLTNP